MPKSKEALLEREKLTDDNERRAQFSLRVFDAVKLQAATRGFSQDFAVAVTGMAALECGWGSEKNEWGEPTLYAAANNIFSIKHDVEQYTEADYRQQTGSEKFYIHHTKEYFGEDKSRFTEHYEAFRSYGSIQESVKDFFDLLERRYPKTIGLARVTPDAIEQNPKKIERMLEMIVAEGYATDPQYATLAASTTKRVTGYLREYGEIL